VKGRSITDNCMTTQEILHSMDNQALDSSLMLLKLDIQHVSDRMKWHYILEVLSRFSLNELWCKWIAGCIITPRFVVLVNRETSDWFNYSPLLPLHDHPQHGSTHKRSLTCEYPWSNLWFLTIPRGPSINQLALADDCLLLEKANLHEAEIISNIVEECGSLLGQDINVNKSCIRLGRAVHHRQRRILC